jgi:uncharacterized membrane protein
MPARDLVFRVIAVPVVLLAVTLIAWMGVKILDGFFAGMTGPPASLGWTDGGVILTFFGYSVVAIILVVFIWMWVSPVRDDVRQEQRGPF